MTTQERMTRAAGFVQRDDAAMKRATLRWTCRLALACGYAAILLGIVVTIGWIFDIGVLKSVAPGLRSMKFNNALAFASAGAALVLYLRDDGRYAHLAPWFGLFTAIIGALTLLEYVADINIGIDELIFSNRDEGGRTIPGRMGPATAFTHMLLGAALALPRAPSPRNNFAFLALTVAGAIAPFAAIIGYIYVVPELYAPGPFSSMALHTAVGFMAVFIGASALRADIGWMAIVTSQGTAGTIARILLPAVFILSIIVAWVRLQGELMGLYDQRTGGAVGAILSFIVVVAIVWFAAARLNSVDKARRRQEGLRQTMFDAAYDAIIMMNDSGEIIDWNRQAEKVYGWTRQEVLGRKLVDTIVPMSLRSGFDDSVRLIALRTQEEAVSRRAEALALRKDGTEFPVEVIVVPLRLEDGLIYSGFVRDLTEQKRTENQLRQAQKMEVVGQLTGGIAHDFNNLLTVIIGSMDVALAKVPDTLTRPIEIALQAAERGAKLVQQLLAVSRRQTLIASSLDVNEAVRGMNELLRTTVGESIQIERHLSSDLWPATADKSQVENALLNLVVNARDAMPNGGKLTIETSNVLLDEAYAQSNEVSMGEYVLLAVTDTGSGMPPEVLQKAFEPFFTTKAVGKGSGLGLAMIYGFAKQSRGHLKIYSEVGHGTTVRLYLPRDPSAPATPARAPIAAASEPQGHESVLVVDDDVAVRSFVVSQLRDLGYRVIEAGDAAAAKAILDGDIAIDVMLTDVVLPGGVTGRALAESVSGHRRALRVLFMSGYTENSIVHDGKLDPGVVFLPKPFTRAALARKIREALGERV